jgi:DNA-binding beta-propeller fold protein YncE
MTATQVPLAETPEPATEEEEPRRRRRLLLLLFLLFLLFALLILALWYLLFRQPITPSIPGIPDASLPHYSTSIYGVDGPIGVASTASGDRVFVSQGEGIPGVLIFDGNGTKVGEFAVPPGPTHLPAYLAIDPLTQEVYVSDRMAGTIYIYTAAGRLQREFRPVQKTDGWQPLGLTFDSAGNLYVTDLSGTAMQVEVFDRKGALLRTLGADANLLFPNGVSLDAAGNAWITDSNNGRLLVFDPAGKIIAQIGRGVGEGNLGMPRGVVVADQRVFVADNTAFGVFAYRPLGGDTKGIEYVGFLGGEGVTDGKFEYPNGIAADGRGRIYVTDSGNDRVQVWSY